MWCPCPVLRALQAWAQVCVQGPVLGRCGWGRGSSELLGKEAGREKYEMEPLGTWSRRGGEAEALPMACYVWVPLPPPVLGPHFGSRFLLSSVCISFSLAHFLRSHPGKRETLGLPKGQLHPWAFSPGPGQGSQFHTAEHQAGQLAGLWDPGD